MANFLPNTLQRVFYQQIRYLPRWSHRTPKRVLPPDYEELKDEEQEIENIERLSTIQPKRNQEPPEFKVKPNKNLVPLSISSQKKKVVVTDMLETVIDSEGNFIYSKMKNNDIRVGNLLTKLKTKKDKVTPEKVLLEGKRLIKDALISGCKVDYIIFSRMSEVEYLRPFLPKLGTKLYKMPYKEMQIWSDLTTNPGIMAVVHTPKVEEFTSPNSLPLTVICDNVRDPTNLGAILRACSGVGCHKVILTKGCVNIWDSKVLRSSSGAHFKLQMHQKQDWTKIQNLLGKNVNMFVADNSHKQMNELQESVPLLPYYGIKYDAAKHTVIVVGGETEGISLDCYKTLSQYNGVRINIPLSNNVDSLNNGMAVGIIVFEVKRQLAQNSL